MSYALIVDLQNRLTQAKLIDLCDFNNTGLFDTAAQARAQTALDTSSAIIDSYCGGRYKLPLQVSVQLVDVCVDLAIAKLYSGRQRKLPDEVKAAQDLALAYLKNVSSGVATLAQATVTQTSEMNVVRRPDDCTQHQAFDPHKLKAY